MFGSDGATQTSPTETVDSRSNWCWRVTPLLVVFSSPPEAVAAHQVLGSDSHTETATILPPMLAGPMQRQVRGSSQPGGNGEEGRPGGAAGAGCSADRACP